MDRNLASKWSICNRNVDTGEAAATVVMGYALRFSSVLC